MLEDTKWLFLRDCWSFKISTFNGANRYSVKRLTNSANRRRNSQIVNVRRKKKLTAKKTSSDNNRMILTVGCKMAQIVTVNCESYRPFEAL